MHTHQLSFTWVCSLLFLGFYLGNQVPVAHKRGLIDKELLTSILFPFFCLSKFLPIPGITLQINGYFIERNKDAHSFDWRGNSIALNT